MLHAHTKKKDTDKALLFEVQNRKGSSKIKMHQSRITCTLQLEAPYPLAASCDAETPAEGDAKRFNITALLPLLPACHYLDTF